MKIITKTVNERRVFLLQFCLRLFLLGITIFIIFGLSEKVLLAYYRSSYFIAILNISSRQSLYSVSLLVDRKIFVFCCHNVLYGFLEVVIL